MTKQDWIDVTERLLPDPTKLDELEAFMAGTGDADELEPGVITYFAPNVRFNYSQKKHSLRSIEVSSERINTTYVRLEAEAHKALSDSGTDVCLRYIFNMQRFEGAFKYKNSFQLLPAPADAPRPPSHYGWHPLLLEFSFRRSSNDLVSKLRANRRFSELGLMLSIFIRNLSLPNQSSSHEWALIRSADGTYKTEYVQLDYWGPKSITPKDDSGFSVQTGFTPMPLVPDDQYYSALGVSCSKPSVLPESLSRLLTYFDGLSDETKKKVLRSAYWMQASQKFFHVSQSASYLALVMAIETILPKDSSGQKCPECSQLLGGNPCPKCGKPRLGIGKNFRDFVERFAPSVPKRMRTRFYDVRSTIAHGSALLPGDLGESAWRFYPQKSDSNFERIILVNVVRVCLVNWICAQAGNA